MIIESIGTLDFTPENKTKKHENQSSWKRFAMIVTGCEVDRYYAWFIEKRFGLKLNKTLRGAHISIVNDMMDKEVFDQAASIFHGKQVTFYYDPSEIRTNAEHWWIKITCPEAESIRESMGLSRIPYFNFHLTIGYANEKNLNHSDYVLRTLKTLNI